LQNAFAEKAAWWAAMCYAGLALKAKAPPLLRCSNTASAAPQNQANCTRQKFARWAAI